jgi:sugar (pentulose or hexulose) kinase
VKKFLIGIDAGTSMVKSVVFDDEGNELAVARQRTAVLNPRPNWDEQDMNEVWEAVVKTIKEAVTKSGVSGKEICAIGVTGQGDGCWLIDEKGNPVRPAILWSDGRAGDIIARWQA